MMDVRIALIALALSLAACASTSNNAYQAPLSGPVTKGYGQTEAGFHHGINIAGVGGDRVQAAMDGLVIKTGKSKRSGRYVVIDHGGGVQTTYASLSRTTVGRGASVRRGQTIGKIGKSGEPAQLHFQMRIAKKSIDPVPFLVKPADGVAQRSTKKGPKLASLVGR